MTVLVGLGANLGEPEQTLRGALAGLRDADGVEVLAGLAPLPDARRSGRRSPTT